MAEVRLWSGNGKDEKGQMMFRNILAVAAIATLPAAATFAQTASPVIDVAKSAGCACCNGWIARMEEAGFTLEPRNISSDDLYDLKMTTGIPMDLWACHTASVAGYTVEGHVPGTDIRRL
ncbi:MAG: DUF411 domain-containing protein, partial [Paracoccaceae bacterium]